MGTTSGAETVTTTGSASGTSGTADDGLDLPPVDSGCPPTSEVALCIPETAEAPAFCLCSRQSLGPGRATVGDLDGDGLDDLLVSDDALVPWRSTNSELEELPPADLAPDGARGSALYVPGIHSVVYRWVLNEELHFRTFDLVLGASPASVIPLPADPGLDTRGVFGDFDGDGAVDLALTTREPAMDGLERTGLLLYMDAQSEPEGVELLWTLSHYPVNVEHRDFLVCDFDADGADDLWVDLYADDYPQILWGTPGSGLSLSGPQTIRPHHCFDFEGDGPRELLATGPGYSAGDFSLVAQPSPRTFERAAIVSGDDESLYGNNVIPVRLDGHWAVLCLASSDSIDDPRSFLGVTYVDSLERVDPMRVAVLENTYVWLEGTLDVEGDGRDEVVAAVSMGEDETVLHVFDVVEAG